MPITTIERAADGTAWGWESTEGQWVPVDPEAFEGSFLGNLGRAAGRGFEDVGQGVRELLGGDDERTRLEGEILAEEQALAQRAAPWAESIGGAAPEVAAGLGVAAATGGAGLVPMLAAEAASGGAIGFLRPGTIEERAANAAFGAAANMVGAGLGVGAAKGIQGALTIGRGIIGGSSRRVAQAVEEGGRRIRMADEEAALTAGRVPGESGARPAGGSSVGARQTPAEELPAGYAETQRAQDFGEEQGEFVNRRPVLEAEERRATDLGYQSPMWAGTGKGSAARNVGAAFESTPYAEPIQARRAAHNNKLLTRAAAKAGGLANDMGPENVFDTIQMGDLVRAEDYISQGFEALVKEMPEIGNRQILKALGQVDVAKGHVPSTRGETLIQDMRNSLAQAQDGATSSEAFVRDTQAIAAHMAKAYADGDQASGEMLMQALNALYDVAERATKGAVKKGGGTRDETIVQGWAALRREANLVRMLQQPGVISGERQINTRSLLNRMRRKKSAGGFGAEGPPEGSAQRDLWDLLVYDEQMQTGVPQTGVRQAYWLSRMPGPRAVGVGAAAAAGGGLMGLLD